METNGKNYAERRKVFMETYNNDLQLTKTMPEIAQRLFKDEFGININNSSYIPIVFVTAWTEILKYIQSQKKDQFSMNVCGIRIEYITELSESDKCRNIVPQMAHEKTPIFTKQEHQITSGVTVNDELLKTYSSWRTVNLLETIGKIERDVQSIVADDYGIDLIVPETTFPMMSTLYAAGLQLARKSHQTVNMYNIFEIDVTEDDKVILTPLAIVKQYLKNDSKR